jgi:hypothetical protein
MEVSIALFCVRFLESIRNMLSVTYLLRITGYVHHIPEYLQINSPTRLNLYPETI